MFSKHTIQAGDLEEMVIEVVLESEYCIISLVRA